MAWVSYLLFGAALGIIGMVILFVLVKTRHQTDEEYQEFVDECTKAATVQEFKDMFDENDD